MKTKFGPVKVEETQIPESACLHCGAVMDGASSMFGKKPRPGNIAICIDCGHVMVFAEDMTKRNPTDEEMHDIAGLPELLLYQRALAAMKREKESVEVLAAYLWQKENPTMSVFACDVAMKEQYRERAREILKGGAK